MDSRSCADCAKEAPETETDYTLISSQFGWRLSRRGMVDGTYVVEWRCPECWREYKKIHGGISTFPPPPPGPPQAGPLIPLASRRPPRRR